MPSFRPLDDVELKIETKVVTSGHPPPIAQRFGIRIFNYFKKLYRHCPFASYLYMVMAKKLE